MKRIFLAFVAMLATFELSAEQPYKHSIGGVLGNMEGLSYKTFFAEHVAMQLDFGFKFAYRDAWILEANPNVVYQGLIHDWDDCSMQWFAGGGLSVGLGYPWNFGYYYGYSYSALGGTALGKFGLNTLGGVELYFHNVPLTLQTDFRPGYGMFFDRDGAYHFFDWAYTVSLRYTIK